MSIFGSKLLGPDWDELSEVIDLDQSHFPHPWKPLDWLDLRSDQYLLYRWASDPILAFALFSRLPQDETAHLLKICLHPSVRGQGLSTKFWSEIIEQLRLGGVKFIYLEVQQSNARAIHFYEKVGFQKLCIIKGFYSTGESAITMQLVL